MSSLASWFLFCTLVVHHVAATPEQQATTVPIGEPRIAGETGTATFPCTAAPMEPNGTVSVKWYFTPGSNVPPKRIPSRRRHRISNTTLTVVSLIKNDAGLYTCVTGKGDVSSQSFSLFVASVIPDRGSFVPSRVNDSAELHVFVGGNFILKVYYGHFNFGVSVMHAPDTPFCDFFHDGGQCKRHAEDTGTVFIVSSLLANESGTFTINANASGLLRSYQLTVIVHDNNFSNIYIILGATAACLVISSIGCIVVYRCRLRRQSLAADEESLVGDNEPLIPLEYEFPRERLSIAQQIGEGTYETVVRARADNILPSEPSTIVAVKMAKKSTGDSVLHVLLSELTMLIEVGHHRNIVNFLGAVTRDVRRKELWIINEFCEHGSLDGFLRSNAEGFVDCHRVMVDEPRPYPSGKKRGKRTAPAHRTFTTNHLLHWAAQVASGMAYLASRNVLHGDLSARNVLLTGQYVAKVSDFGLVRNVQLASFYKKQSELLIKWLALESISNQTFSTRSDVWAYGVLLWELFSLGAVPYGRLERAVELVAALFQGHRLERPEYASREIYDQMVRCWMANPGLRPTFEELFAEVNAMLPMGMRIAN